MFVYLITDALGRLPRLPPATRDSCPELPAWTVRVGSPAHLAERGQGFLQNAWDQLASPMSEPVLTELRWYFEQRRHGRSAALTVEDRAASRLQCGPSRPSHPGLYRAGARTARPRSG